MGNIVHDLVVELARVQAMLGNLDGDARLDAQNLLRWGREQMALNSYEGMRDAIEDLRKFPSPRNPDSGKKEPER